GAHWRALERERATRKQDDKKAPEKKPAAAEKPKLPLPELPKKVGEIPLPDLPKVVDDVLGTVTDTLKDVLSGGKEQQPKDGGNAVQNLLDYLLGG
ncbi:MAG TPA: hypothetical protein VFZ89_01710, partial [Solirubrobacteraceae bacterium]